MQTLLSDKGHEKGASDELLRKRQEQLEKLSELNAQQTEEIHLLKSELETETRMSEDNRLKMTESEIHTSEELMKLQSLLKDKDEMCEQFQKDLQQYKMEHDSDIQIAQDSKTNELEEKCENLQKQVNRIYNLEYTVINCRISILSAYYHLVN